jgi:hypothetical protein
VLEFQKRKVTQRFERLFFSGRSGGQPQQNGLGQEPELVGISSSSVNG